MRKNLKKIALCMLMAAMTMSATGCSKSDSNAQNTTEQNENNSDESDNRDNMNNKDNGKKQQDEKEAREIFDKLFSIDNKVSIKIDISDEEIDKLQQDFGDYQQIDSKSPIYRRADRVTFMIGDKSYEIEDVGIRIKGNTSRKPIIDGESQKRNATHFRLSFDETFDDEKYYGKDAVKWDEEERKERKKRTFATLSSLEIKWNSTMDSTYTREYYAYEMFRENGVLSQHTNLSELNLGDISYGVVKIYEPVDKEFIKKYIPEEDQGGELYKCAWTHSPANYTLGVTMGIANEDERLKFNYSLKTEKKTSKNEQLKNLLDVLNTGTPAKEEYDSVIDGDYLANFLAVSYFTGNPDDMRNNYNNHYVYFLKSSGKAIFIPYDYDRCFGITYQWNPDGTGMTAVSPFSTKAEAGHSEQKNPVIRYGIMNDGYILDEYKASLQKVVDDGWISGERFNEYYEKFEKNYADAAVPKDDLANVGEEFMAFKNLAENEKDYVGNMSVKDYLSKIKESYETSLTS